MLIEEGLKKYIIMFYSLIVVSAIFLATSTNLVRYQQDCVNSASIVAKSLAPSNEDELDVNVKRLASAERLLTYSLRRQLESNDWEYKLNYSESQQYSSFVIESLKLVAKSTEWYALVFRFLSIVSLILAINVILYCRSLH